MNLDVMRHEIMEIYRAVAHAQAETLENQLDQIHVGVDEILRLWEQEKEWMFPFFDDDARVTLDAPPTSINRRTIDEVLHGDLIAQQVAKIFPAGDQTQRRLCLSLRELMHHFRLFLIDLIGQGYNDDLESNKISTDLYDSYPAYTKNVPAGARITKLFKEWLEIAAYNMMRPGGVRIPREDFDILMESGVSLMGTLYSMLISKTKANGNSKLCLSIRPADLLLQSAHTAGNWRSCHSIINGEYRTAGQSYTIDGVTAIGFTYSEETPVNLEAYSSPRKGMTDLILPKKLWRQLIHIHPEGGAVFSRHYPTRITSSQTALIDVVSDLITSLTPATTAEVNTRPEFSPTSPSRWAFADGSAALINESYGDRRRYRTAVSHVCIICGEATTPGHPGQHYCDDCENMGRQRCPMCNEYYEEDSMVWVDHRGEGVCEGCYDYWYFICEICEDTHHREDGMYNLRDSGGVICETCHEEAGYESCHICGFSVPEDEITHATNNDAGFCPTCVADIDRNRAYIGWFRCAVCEGIHNVRARHNVFHAQEDGQGYIQERRCRMCTQSDAITRCRYCGEHVIPTDTMECPVCRVPLGTGAAL